MFEKGLNLTSRETKQEERKIAFLDLLHGELAIAIFFEVFYEIGEEKLGFEGLLAYRLRPQENIAHRSRNARVSVPEREDFSTFSYTKLMLSKSKVIIPLTWSMAKMTKKLGTMRMTRSIGLMVAMDLRTTNFDRMKKAF